MTETNKKLTRRSIVSAVAKRRPEFIKVGVQALVNETLDVLADAIASGQQVEIRRLGVFSPRELKPRRSTNPKTGLGVIAKRYRGVKFKMSVEIKRKLADLRKSDEPSMG